MQYKGKANVHSTKPGTVWYSVDWLHSIWFLHPHIHKPSSSFFYNSSYTSETNHSLPLPCYCNIKTWFFFFFLENIDSDKKVLLLKRDAAHPAYKRLINYYSTLIISGLRFKSMSFKGHYCFICQQLLFGRVFTWEQRSPSFFYHLDT